MSKNPYPRCCGACRHRFVPWRVWLITRWTCIKCPRCGTQLNRRIDRQLVEISFFLCFAIISALLLPIPLAWRVILTLAATLFTWVIDAFTVRLVPAGRWRGWLGYSCDNAAPKKAD